MNFKLFLCLAVTSFARDSGLNDGKSNGRNKQAFRLNTGTVAKYVRVCSFGGTQWGISGMQIGGSDAGSNKAAGRIDKGYCFEARLSGFGKECFNKAETYASSEQVQWMKLYTNKGKTFSFQGQSSIGVSGSLNADGKTVNTPTATYDSGKFGECIQGMYGEWERDSKVYKLGFMSTNQLPGGLDPRGSGGGGGGLSPAEIAAKAANDLACRLGLPTCEKEGGSAAVAIIIVLILLLCICVPLIYYCFCRKKPDAEAGVVPSASVDVEMVAEKPADGNTVNFHPTEEKPPIHEGVEPPKTNELA